MQNECALQGNRPYWENIRVALYSDQLPYCHTHTKQIPARSSRKWVAISNMEKKNVQHFRRGEAHDRAFDWKAYTYIKRVKLHLRPANNVELVKETSGFNPSVLTTISPAVCCCLFPGLGDDTVCLYRLYG